MNQNMYVIIGYMHTLLPTVNVSLLLLQEKGWKECSIFLNDNQDDAMEQTEEIREERGVTKMHECIPCVGENARTCGYREKKKHKRRARLRSNKEQDPRMMCIG